MGSKDSKLIENFDNSDLNHELKYQRPKAEANFSSLQEIQVKDPGEPENSIEIEDCDYFDRSPQQSNNTLNYQLYNCSTRMIDTPTLNHSPHIRGILKGRSQEKYSTIFNEEAKFVRFAIKPSYCAIKSNKVRHACQKQHKLESSESKKRVRRQIL